VAAHGLSDPPSGITLRPAGSSDRDFLLQVYGSTREDELSLVDWSAEQKAAFAQMQFDAQDAYYRGHYQPATFDVVEADGEPVGRLYVARREDEICIIDVALLPQHRRRGIGTTLIRALLDEAAVSGKRLSIHVEKHNPARRLYERLGFAEVADHGLYLLMEVAP
jgi:GNAT superfamily N-acetyltransferase